MVMKTAEDATLAVMALAETCSQFLRNIEHVERYRPGMLGAPAEPSSRCQAFVHWSTAVGKLVMEAAATRILPVSLELGGKSPWIDFPDATDDWLVVCNGKPAVLQSRCNRRDRLHTQPTLAPSADRTGRLARSII